MLTLCCLCQVWNANDEIASFNGMGGHGYGIPNGNRWVPAHCDAVLRRHYWFWAQEGWGSDADLNNASKLLQMHLTSIGRGCNMVLDMSPDTTGLLQEVVCNWLCLRLHNVADLLLSIDTVLVSRM